MKQLRTSILACLLAFAMLLQCCATAEVKSDFPEYGKYVLKWHACYNDGYCHTGHLNTVFWRLSKCQDYADNNLAEAINSYAERRGGLKEGYVQCGFVTEDTIDV